ncbi:MAG: hypothetical protein EZS28_051348, partial [Streblomastix strix]
NEEPNKLPEDIPSSLKNCVMRMLDKNPESRITSSEILALPEVSTIQLKEEQELSKYQFMLSRISLPVINEKYKEEEEKDIEGEEKDKNEEK